MHPFRKTPYLPLLAAIATLALAPACAPHQPPTDQAAQAAIDQAVRRLQSGATITELNRAASAQNFLASLALPPGASVDAGTPPVASPSDPCPEVPLTTYLSIDEERAAYALQQFGACLRKIIQPVRVVSQAIEYLRTYSRSVLETPLTTMSDPELESFLKDHFISPILLVGQSVSFYPIKARVRNSFSNRELDELERLARRRMATLRSAEAQIFLAVDAHHALIQNFAVTNNRYAMMLALRETAMDSTGEATAQRLLDLLKDTGMALPKNPPTLSIALLHPVAIVASIPDEDKEFAPLSSSGENPFTLTIQYLSELGGSTQLIQEQRTRYSILRENDNPPLPPHQISDANAVRVAVLDTGVDFLRYPELGLFMGDGGDFADGDLNPYIRAEGDFAHGTGTAASVLTVLAHYAPEVLRERKLDLAIWKTASIREVLSLPYESGAVNWNSRFGFQEALLEKMSDKSVKPKIVSISAAFPLQVFLKLLGKPDLVLDSQWLWVMAAGNYGRRVEDNPIPSCLSDVPSGKRVDDRVLCIGALKRGILNDKIAASSSFGDRVDVYAYDSYIELCPNGTSCATPAVTGAAAALAAKYPQIKAEEIKALIVASAEEQILEVDSSKNLDARVTVARKVKVFDPATMMPRMFELASHKFGY